MDFIDSKGQMSLTVVLRQWPNIKVSKEVQSIEEYGLHL